MDPVVVRRAGDGDHAPEGRERAGLELHVLVDGMLAEADSGGREARVAVEFVGRIEVGRAVAGFEFGLHRVEKRLAGVVDVPFADPAALLHHAGAGYVGVVAFGRGEQAFEIVGIDPVVGVDECDPFAGGQVHARVAGASLAFVPLRDDPDPGVARGEVAQDGERSVGAFVVDADDLDVAQRLCGQALQAAGQVALDVVDGDDDADFRSHGYRM